MKRTIPTPDTPLQKMLLDSLVRNPDAHFSVYSKLWLSWGQWQLNGESWMLKTSACPNIGEESFSSLTSILEPNPAEQYSLSPKACRGIMRRIEKHGQTPPPEMNQIVQDILASEE